MQREEGSFHWSEDFNEALNYWFWRHQLGELAEQSLIDRARRTLGRAPFEAHLEVRTQPGFEEFLKVWRRWKLDQTTTQITAGRAQSPAAGRAHYEAVAAVAPRPFTIQWVMAPFGERWVFPPDLVILGAEGGDPSARRQAVLEAASALGSSG